MKRGVWEPFPSRITNHASRFTFYVSLFTHNMAVWAGMKKFRFRWRTVVCVLLLCWCIVMLFRFEHSQVYHPSREWEATGAELGRPFENVLFKASDGVELSGWF